MISHSVRFSVDERQNVHSTTGKEWALNVRFDRHERWTIKAWDKEPSAEAVKDAKETVMRSFEVYHRHLYVPAFNVTEVTTLQGGCV